MRHLMASLAAFTLCLAVACGGGDDDDSAAAGSDGTPRESAFKALERQLNALADGQAGRVYDELHPAQQALIARDLYVRCVGEAGSFNVEGIKEVESYEEETGVPGTDVTAKGTAVTISYTMVRGLLKAEQRDTWHVFPVDGKWRFTVRDPQPFKEGRCP